MAKQHNEILTRDSRETVLERIERDDEFCKSLLAELGFSLEEKGTGWRAEHVSETGATFAAYEKTLAKLARGIYTIWTIKDDELL